MIRSSYSGGPCSIFQCSGSVFPSCMLKALPSTFIAGVLQRVFPDRTLSIFGEDGGILTEAQVWGAFTFLVSFLIVFRTSQAYSRWWEGCTACQHMRAEWFDATSSLVSFCKHSKADQQAVSDFKGMLVRLVSMLHALASAHVETGGADEGMVHKYQLISPDAIDEVSLETLRESNCKVELVFTWLQQLVVDNISTGVLSIPPPILSRAFQEYANGMVHYYTAMQIALTPFPFAYAQTCDCLLLLHWAIVPVITSQWATHWMWAALFAFVQVFVIQTLNKIATELENPFGVDANDVDGEGMQREMNRHLRMLASKRTARTPELQKKLAPSMTYWTESSQPAEGMTGSESVASVRRSRKTLKTWLAGNNSVRLSVSDSRSGSERMGRDSFNSLALEEETVSEASREDSPKLQVAHRSEAGHESSPRFAAQKAALRSEASPESSSKLQAQRVVQMQDQQPGSPGKHVVLDAHWAPEAFAYTVSEADTLACSPLPEGGKLQVQTGSTASSDHLGENRAEPATQGGVPFCPHPRAHHDCTPSKTASKHGNPRAPGGAANETLAAPSRNRIAGPSQKDEPKLPPTKSTPHAPNGVLAR